MNAPSDWSDVLQASSLLRLQTASTASLLEPLSQAFLGRVSLKPMDSLELDASQRRRIAAEACVPIVHLGLDWYSSVREVLIYPGPFIVDHCWFDDDGIEHQARGELAGEAWEGGPVILAWDEIARGGTPGHETYNVVVHEFAHVLDARNGAVNGFPPIADAALAGRWTEVFQNAFDSERRALEHGQPLVLDEYATENPAEFFAVASEHFFTSPEPVRLAYPDVHDCLQRFFLNGSVDTARRLF